MNLKLEIVLSADWVLIRNIGSGDQGNVFIQNVIMTKTKVSIIVATDKNGVIGKAGKIPWYCSEDLKYFKKKTVNQTIIMGRKTYDSLGNRPLKNRLNIVISASLKKAKFDINLFNEKDGPFIVASLEESLRLAREKNRGEIFVVGGQSIYNLFLGKNLIQKIYHSIMDIKIKNGDAWFEYDESNWNLNCSISYKTFTLRILEKGS